MAWASPRFSNKVVDKAGDDLIDEDAFLRQIRAMEVVGNWRSSHHYPLNTFQMWLRRNATEEDPESDVVQRIKRRPSIEAKLRRFNWLKLSAMQDIGGCRAVVNSVESVDRLVARYKSARFEHKLDDERDYIRNPKKSGYRGYHLVYLYRNRKKKAYTDLKIEVQLRTKLQHAWATAVETVDTFTRQALKASSGQTEWLRFFKLVGSAIAIREGMPLVPGTPTDEAVLKAEIRQLAKQLNVADRLHAYGIVIEKQDNVDKDARHFVVVLDSEERTVDIQGFKAHESRRATREYAEREKAVEGHPGADVVLISAESLTAMKRGYPNYWLDTRVFLNVLEQATTGAIGDSAISEGPISG